MECGLFFVMFPALWLASHFGITGLAAGQAILMAGLVIPMWYFLIRPPCGARLGEYLMTLLSPLSAALIAVLAGYLAVSHLSMPLWRSAVRCWLRCPSISRPVGS